METNRKRSELDLLKRPHTGEINFTLSKIIYTFIQIKVMIDTEERWRRIDDREYKENLIKYSFHVLQAVLTNNELLSRLEGSGVKVNTYCVDAAESMLNNINERFDEKDKPKKKK